MHSRKRKNDDQSQKKANKRLKTDQDSLEKVL